MNEFFECWGREGSSIRLKEKTICGHKIRFVEIDGEPWVVAKDICNVLKIKNHRATLSKLPKSTKKKYKTHTNGGPQNVSFINKHGLIILLTSSRSQFVKNVAEGFEIDLSYYSLMTKEQTTLSVITKAFKHLKQEFQYQVGKYRVDLYFPDVNIVVECDEFDHRGYDKQREEKRMLYIKQKLGCKIIRFNPDEKDFNVGDVINEIMFNIQNNDKKVS